MSTTHPQLANEFHPSKNGDISPDNIVAGTHKKIWWICKEISENPCGHIWQSTGSHRTHRSQGCPPCGILKRAASRSLPKEGNSMRRTHPKLAMEFHPSKNNNESPDSLTAGTGKTLWWVCKSVSEKPCGHEWTARGRTRLKHGCPACSNQSVHIDGRNSLEKTEPNLAKEFHPTKNGDYNPRNITWGSGKKLWWKCIEISENPCGHEWEASPDSRSRRNFGCPACINQALHIDGRNSMRNTNNVLTKDFHPTLNGDLTPDDLIAGTHLRLWWKCHKCEHEWEAPGNTRHHSGGQCSACINQVLHSNGKNSMRRTHPEISSEFHTEKNGDLSPDNILMSTKEKIWWVCKTVSAFPCGNEWESSGSSRKSGAGCHSCANQAVHSDGHNSLRNTHPELVKEFHPTKNNEMTPDNLVAGTNKRISWICTSVSKNPCGFEWVTSGAKRSGELQGCPNCAEYGIKPYKPGIFYVNLVLNWDGDILEYKGGVSNNDYTKRFKVQKRSLKHNYPNLSYEHLEYIEFDIVKDAIELESKLKNIDNRPSREFDGGTELFISNPIDIAIEMGWLESMVERKRQQYFQ